MKHPGSANPHHDYVHPFHDPDHVPAFVLVLINYLWVIPLTLIVALVVVGGIGLLDVAVLVIVTPLAVVFVALTLWIRSFRLLIGHVLMLRQIASRETGFAQGPLLYWLRAELKAIHVGLGELRGGGWSMNKRQYNSFMLSLEKASDNPGTGYTGTTGDRPSVWRKRYPWVFDAEPMNLMKGPHLRLLIIDKEILRADIEKNDKEYKDFRELHDRHTFELRCVDPSEANRLDHHKLGRYITLWKQYAIVSVPEVDDDGELVVKTELVCEEDEQKFKDIRNYVNELVKPNEDGDSTRPTIDEYIAS
jgi:hypothetical protein